MTDNGIVTVPGHVRMSVSEIADLFGIYYRTAKRYIRAIEKSGINIYPDYYGLEIIIALASRIQSRNAEVFREWLCGKAIRKEIPEMPVMSIQNNMLNGICLLL